MLGHFGESKEVFRDELSECLKTKQNKNTRNLGLRYCGNKMHKMLNENLIHKNGFMHVYMYMFYILMNLIGYIGLLDIPVF